VNPDGLGAALDDLAAQGLLRRRRVLSGPQGARVTLDGREVLAFASNDYLGLANHPDLRNAARAALDTHGLGGGASHLLSGHTELHHAAEEALAAFVGLPAALLFSTGYMANLGVLSALADRHTEVFADRLNHASLNDAALMARARPSRYAHADMQSLARLLAASTARTRIIVSDAVFSMDGDIAPINELLELAERFDAWLLLDDAHGFGVLKHAETGRWPLAPRLIYMATLGKAAGVAGAFVAGTRQLIDWLVNSAHTYVYTTAQPPMLAAAAIESLAVMAREPWRCERLAEHIARLRGASLPWPLMDSFTPIQPLRVGDTRAALALSEALLARGIFVPAIRPPTVAEGTARLRISLSAAHTAEDVDALLEALRDCA
jgi:8-amino-7-oxononanoate synthase